MRGTPENGTIALKDQGKLLEFPVQLKAEHKGEDEALAGPLKIWMEWAAPTLETNRRLKVWAQAETPTELHRLDLRVPFRFPNGSSLICREFHTTGLVKEYALADILNQKPGLWQRLRRKAEEGVLSYGFGIVRESQNSVCGWSGLSDTCGFLEAELRPRSEEIILRQRLKGLEADSRPLCILNLEIFTGIDLNSLRAYFASFKAPTRYPSALRNLGITQAQADEAGGYDNRLKQDLQTLEKFDFPSAAYLIDLKWPIDRLLSWDPKKEEMILREESLETLSAMARRLEGRGYQPGISLLPLVISSRSAWPKHPESWELPLRREREQASGEQPQSRQMPLNPSNQQLMSYLLQGLKRLPHETGIKFFRLESMTHVERAFGNGQSAAMVTADVLTEIRETLSPAACGFGKLPFQVAARLAQPFRIGPIYSNRWEMTSPKDENQRIAVGTQATLKSLLNHLQYGLTSLYHFGPSFSLRSKSDRFPLNEDEKFTLLLLNLLSNWVIEFRDHFTELTTLAQQTLLAAMPHRTPVIQKLEQQGNFYSLILERGHYEYHAFLNLGDQSQYFSLPEGPIFFDTLSCGWQEGGGRFDIGPHDSRLYLKVPEEAYTVCGSLGHVLPGQEVTRLSVEDPDEIELKLHPLSIQQSHIYLRIPNSLMGARVNGLFYRQMERRGINMLMIDGINCPREWPESQAVNSV